MEILIVIVFGAIASFIASSKGRNGLIWFFIGGFTTIIGVGIILLLPSHKQNKVYRENNAQSSSFERVNNNDEEEQNKYYTKTDNEEMSEQERYHYGILGCMKSDTFENIKLKYKSLIKKYHPDILSSKDLPKDFTDFAEQKFKEVQEAYEFIKKERNIC